MKDVWLPRAEKRTETKEIFFNNAISRCQKTTACQAHYPAC